MRPLSRILVPFGVLAVLSLLARASVPRMDRPGRCCPKASAADTKS